ncbi:MAG: hypothetical protein MUC96_19020 [Myxococcaceae bacterium]|jgi:hypothetical protein|nr:hypothetical protein [Myxococcaceae bacterium]
MSDEPQPAPEQAVSACPLTPDFLPENMRKHVDPKAPVPLRMMAAKALVPLAPPDMLGALFMLMYDPEANVRDTAGKTASTLPDRIAASGFRDEGVQGPVLGWFLEVYAANDAYAEMLVTNSSTPDSAVAAIAASCSQKIAELVGQNQLRLLRHEEIIRQLALNPVAQGALIDGVCDFAIRNGLDLPDVPQMVAAKVRLFGPQAATQKLDVGPTADDVIAEFGVAATGDLPPDAEAAQRLAEKEAKLEEGKKLTLTQRIAKMSISEKIKLATKGNKEVRGILIRDANKLVAVATIRSPRITDQEVMAQALNKGAHEDVLRVIYTHREWTRKYPVRLALVKNPKVPAQITMRFLNLLSESDVKGLAKDKNVAGAVQLMAKKMIQRKNEPKKG